MSTASETRYRARRVLDGIDEEPLQHASVIVRDGDIVEVTADAPHPGAEVVDLGDVTLLPGLVDAHVHLVWNAGSIPHEEVELDASGPRTVLRMAARARTMLEHGITTVRDLGATDSLSLPLAAAIEAGELPGPEVIAVGRALAMTGGHAHQITAEADGPDALRGAVREEIKRGASAVKLMASGGIYDRTAGLQHPQLTLEEMTAAVEEAHKAGVRVAAHAYTPGPINLALDAGVDTIEHGSFLDEPTALRMRDEDRFYVPTMMACHLIVERAEEVGTPDYMLRKALEARAAVRSAVSTALELGTPIAGGTDSGGAGIAHGSLAREAQLFTECGASPARAVGLCTAGSARALGVADRVGSLAPGLRADLLAVRGDLAADITALADVAAVIQAGRVVHRR